MAGDWIKMRADLFTHPKVIRISSALNADRLRTVGGLMSVWCLFDAHSVDGQLEGYTFKTIDDLIGWGGFAAAMGKVGWLEECADGLVLPRFETHNGSSAKRRAQETDRKREARSSASDADKKRTREEKRREDIKEHPHTPSGGNGPEETGAGKPARKAAIALKTFLAECKASGEKPIPESDPVFAYADETGIPLDFLRLHWLEFKERYCAPDAKRYKDWRTVHRKSVRGCWFRLWYLRPDGTCGLTTQGEQAKRHHSKDAA